MKKEVMQEYKKLSIYELNNKLKACNQLLEENKEDKKIVSELLKIKVFIEKLIKEKEEEVKNIKEWYNIELNKEDAEVLKAYLRQNKIYYECSQINNNYFHIEIKCSCQECEFINDFINKYID